MYMSDEAADVMRRALNAIEEDADLGDRQLGMLMADTATGHIQGATLAVNEGPCPCARCLAQCVVDLASGPPGTFTALLNAAGARHPVVPVGWFAISPSVPEPGAEDSPTRVLAAVDLDDRVYVVIRMKSGLRRSMPIEDVVGRIVKPDDDEVTHLLAKLCAASTSHAMRSYIAAMQ